MKLYFSPFSPYVRKCLVTASELGLDDRIELLVANAHPINRDQNIIAINPLGKVPTLITPDGHVLYDSRVICEYFNELGGGSLIPIGGPARWDVLTMQSLGDGILDAALLARYEEVARPESLRWSEWRTAQLSKSLSSLTFLSQNFHLLEGSKVDLGTLSIACALWYLDLRFAELEWRLRFPKIATWYAEFSLRPSLGKTWSVE
ncbi:glutathione S-transferase (plasmid) [Acidovorax sp. DW039]|uniref:glutathione S-transferase family protein n=1 Tax=Acidovorax sp. DW039 TaxID=3095606 RepID=UPI003092ED33|nr:glutathione S-transferase [Acidovorax sp. DW039]